MRAHFTASLLLALGLSGCTCVGVPGELCVGDGCSTGCTGSECVPPTLDSPACTDTVTAAQDATTTWTPTGPSGGRVSAALSVPGAVLVGTGYSRGFGLVSGRGGAIYRSVDQGQTYQPVLRVPGASVNALVAVPGTERVYAAVASISGAATDGVYVSNDGGASFTLDNQGLHSLARVRALALAAGSPERLYALLAGDPINPTAATASLYRRDDGGAWTLAAMGGVDPLLGGPVLALAADTQARDTVYVADGAQFYASADTGTTFTPVANGLTLFGNATTANVEFLRNDAASPGHLLLGTSDDELLETFDSGANWSRVAIAGGVNDATVAGGKLWVGGREAGLLAGATSSALEHVGVCLVDPSVTAVVPLVDAADVVVVGTTGNAYVSNDGGKTFAPSSGLDELLGRVVTSGDSVWLMSAAGLYRSTDGGKVWARVAAGVGTISFSDVAADPADADHVWLASDEDLFEGRSPALGLISLKLSDGTFTRATGLGRNVAAVATDASSPGRLYAYQRQGARDTAPTPVATGVFVSSDNGQSFSATPVQGQSLVLRSTYRFSPLAVGTGGDLFAGVVNPANAPALARSTGPSAQPTEVWSEAAWVPYGVHSNSLGDVYLVGRGASVGVKKSTDQGVTFAPNDDGLIGFAKFVYQLAFAPGGGLVVATQGGAFYAAGGTTFSELTGFTGAAPVAWSVAVAPTTPPTAIVTTEAGVFRRLLP